MDDNTEPQTPDNDGADDALAEAEQIINGAAKDDDEFDADETGAERGHISVDSPVAKALLRRQVGDEVTVRRPAGEMVYEILAVHVTDPAG